VMVCAGECVARDETLVRGDKTDNKFSGMGFSCKEKNWQ
jgi:hypothetical protein